MKRLILGMALGAVLIGCADKVTVAGVDYTQYVDPVIGSGGHGHVFVGANVPRGMVQLGIVNVSEGWDWCSGYHISDTTVIGIAHTHLSGTGIGDKGDVLFMPVVDSPEFDGKNKYISTYDKATEVAEAGYYKAHLNRYNVDIELTASERVGFHRYTYPQGATPQLIVNLVQGIGWDKYTSGGVRMVNDSTIVGERLSKGWADDDRVYFVATFNSKIAKIDTVSGYAMITFEEVNPLEASVAISGVDIEGAKANLIAENRSFDAARSDAKQSWNKILSTIDVKGGTEEQMKTFYTALYHANFFPSLFNDVNGNYRGADGQIHNSTEDVYTIFSLWDTYRAAHPLFTITEPSKVATMVNTMLDIFDQQGKLPVWHLSGNETDCMVGFGSVQVVGDAIMKDIPGFDYKRAYNAMKAYADLDERGLKEIREMGFVPADKDVESVARAMEYAISDWAVAQVAQKLGDTANYNKFTQRSLSYKKYFDKNDHFVKGIMSDGSFRNPFDPAHSTHRGDDFCEGNSWQYSWMVPHDFAGLIALYPSPEAAEAKLDSLFNTPYVPQANASPDISGMIGQYSHGNEPSHSTIYAYAALGKPEKTAKLSKFILDSLYSAKPDGLSGNEDAGQMSSWYILNAMGLYQPNPALGEFVITSPLFETVTLHLENGKHFTIKTVNKGDKVYHKEAFLKGVPYTKPTINYNDLTDGGMLELIY